MRVHPLGEGPGGLHVAELLAGDEVAVLGGPAHGEGPGAHAQHDTAIGDAAVPLDHLHRFPGRGQALEGAWPLVPAKHGVGRGVEMRTPDEELDALRFCHEPICCGAHGMVGYCTWQTRQPGW